MTRPSVAPPPMVMTVGHSTRSLAEFLRLLAAHGVTTIVDVRTIPRSRAPAADLLRTAPGPRPPVSPAAAAAEPLCRPSAPGPSG